MLHSNKSVLVLVLVAALSGCSDDAPPEDSGTTPDDSRQSQAMQTQPSILGTVAGSAIGAGIGTMIGNSLSDRDRHTPPTSGVAPYAGGVGSTSGSQSEVNKPGTPLAPKANIISRGGTFSGMNAGS